MRSTPESSEARRHGKRNKDAKKGTGPIFRNGSQDAANKLDLSLFSFLPDFLLDGIVFGSEAAALRG
jgi:hypothetical protein